MAEPKIYEMTVEGIKKLEDELEVRKTEKREDISDRIKQALSFGDISENAEYDDAKAAQAENEARIAEIENLLKHTKAIEDDEISKTKVKIGAVVKIKDEETGVETSYTLVSSKEADMFENKISTDSPVGTAIMGKSKGQVVDVRTPSGTLKYKIVKISKPTA